METKEDYINVCSEQEAIEIIERAFFGECVEIKAVKVIYDNLAEVNSPYDVSSGSRKVSFFLSRKKENITETETLYLNTSTRIYEDYDEEADYDRVIGSHTETFTRLEGSEMLIQEIRDREHEFNCKMPKLLFTYEMALSNWRDKALDEEWLERYHNTERKCDKCGKDFKFNKNKDYLFEGGLHDCGEGQIIGEFWIFCSKACREKFFEVKEDGM